MRQASVGSGGHESSRTGDGSHPPPAGGAAVSPPGDRRLHHISLLLLFILSFVVYHWIFDYVIIGLRESKYCFFMFGSGFLEEFLGHPGGPLMYARRFLAQFYHYPWLGALITSLLITCFSVLFHLVLIRLRHAVWIFHTYLPCILLLTVLQRNVIDVTLGLLMICGAFLGYLSLPRGVIRQVYALVAIPVLYLVVGGHFWFFAVWVIASEWLDRPLSSNLAFKLLCPALAVCVPFAAHRWLFFLIPLSSALTYPLSWLMASSLSTIARFAQIALAGYMLLMPFWARISWGTRLESLRGSKRVMAVHVGLLIVLAVPLLDITYDSEEKQCAEYHHLYKRKQWDAILKKAKSNSSPDLQTQFITNCALFHKGKLLEEMFNYAQVWGTRGLMLEFARLPAAGRDLAVTDFPRAMYNSDLLFEMGHVNAALRHAYNHMAVLGRTYENLRRLAECNMVNGNYEHALKYLNILERTLFHGRFARHCKEMIADANAADAYFAELRARLPAIELSMYRDNFILPLTLLISNAHNRMAFDYLIAWCLLDRYSTPMIADNMHFLKDAGYTSIPTHLQEAITIFQMISGINVDTQGFKCDEDTVSRVRKFNQQRIKYPDGPSAQRGLRSELGGTYMYYYCFQPPPFKLSRVRHVQAHYYLGNTFYSQGKVDLAVTHYSHALRLDPAFVEAHIKLGHALMSLGSYGEAAVHYREALRLKPDSAEARASLDRVSEPKTVQGGQP